MTSTIAPFLDPTRPVDERISDLLGRMTLEEKVGQMLQLDARDDLDDQVLRMHAGSILHASPERVLRARELTAARASASRCWSARTASTATPSGRERRSSRPSSAWPPPGIRSSSSGSRGPPPSRSPPPASTGRSLRCSASRATCAGAASTRRSARTRSSSASSPRRWCAATRAAASTTRPRSSPPRSTSPATPRRRAGATPARPTSRAASSARGSCPPFERVAREGCRTFMLGYQTTDGVPITVNDWLLNDVLRGEWGYTGTLITDWDNVGRMVWEQRIQPDYAHAAAAAVKAGNDMVMTTPGFFQGALDAIEQGLLAEDALDAAVSRILLLKFELGLFENPRLPDAAAIAEVIANPAHTALNLDVARRSLVLLRNEGVLPLAGGLVSDESGRALPSRRRSAPRRGHRPARRRRADAARRLGGIVRAGRLDPERPAARDDHDRPRRPARARARGLGDRARARRRDPDPRGRPRGRVLPRRAAPAAGGHSRCSGRRAHRRGRRRRRARRLRGRRGRRPHRARRRRPIDGDARAHRRAARAARGARRDRHPARRRAARLQAACASGGRDGRRGARLGGQPRHAGRPRDRRAAARPDRADRPPADLVRATRRPAADLLQPDPRSARQPLRRPHAESAVRLRRGPVVLDRGVLGPADRRRRPRDDRHRPCPA